MEPRKHPASISPQAYRTFLEECSKHITRFDELLLHASPQPENGELQVASRHFHTIKGGAGFFGLSDVANFAGALESMLEQTDFEIQSARAEVERIFCALKSAVVKLPPPSGR